MFTRIVGVIVCSIKIYIKLVGNLHTDPNPMRGRGNNLSAYNLLRGTDNNLFVWVSRNWGFYLGT